MLIFNLETWRREKLVHKCFALAQRHPELTGLCDQHLINVQLHGRIQEFDAEWNYQMADYKSRKAIFAEVFETPPRWPKVLHFTTALKPWLMGYDLPWIHLYRETARKTGLSLPEALQ
jgi:lipopolysaccharide biosynthesis glycosyltransferase